MHDVELSLLGPIVTITFTRLYTVYNYLHKHYDSEELERGYPVTGRVNTAWHDSPDFGQYSGRRKEDGMLLILTHLVLYVEGLCRYCTFRWLLYSQIVLVEGRLDL